MMILDYLMTVKDRQNLCCVKLREFNKVVPEAFWQTLVHVTSFLSLFRASRKQENWCWIRYSCSWLQITYMELVMMINCDYIFISHFILKVIFSSVCRLLEFSRWWYCHFSVSLQMNMGVNRCYLLLSPPLLFLSVSYRWKHL